MNTLPFLGAVCFIFYFNLMIMSISQKYGRTYHYPFSPGTTSDDRIQHQYWAKIENIPLLVHTEKLDGENNCLSRYGVFARSHAAPTTSPWTESLRRFWQLIKNDLGPLEIFLENLYAVHSIEYQKLEHHFYVFGIRQYDQWLSWEETKFYAAMLDLPVVPEISLLRPNTKHLLFEQEVIDIASGRGALEPHDAYDGSITTMEGIVSRNANQYPVSEFSNHVFKYVRKGHVKTDEHWTRNWKRAHLNQEGGRHVED